MNKLKNKLILKNFKYLIIILILLFSINLKSEQKQDLPFDILPTTKLVYLDIWASWCGPCKASFPFMNKLQQDFQSKGLQIVAYNVDNKIEDAEKFLQKVNPIFTVVYDKTNKEFLQKLKLKIMPTSYLLDANGNIISIHEGFTNSNKEAIYNEIQSLLNK